MLPINPFSGCPVVSLYTEVTLPVDEKGSFKLPNGKKFTLVGKKDGVQTKFNFGTGTLHDFFSKRTHDEVIFWAEKSGDRSSAEKITEGVQKGEIGLKLREDVFRVRGGEKDIEQF